ncbi:hypothetical protein BP6252_11669 [Coleophoma cylindrospora]|uniref:CCD97-like C-terminal domain-containing protein n=1 Tax=Coleophoma cylindrospora TaxID=1849047 RepID=A0A3D8QK84_9HELO|nr:hypothetical protein BP6252_11669 [Coleophoma cylindrospora]
MPHKEEPPVVDQDVFEAEERAQRVRVKNRRKLYLDNHPSYFTNADLELQELEIRSGDQISRLVAAHGSTFEMGKSSVPKLIMPSDPLLYDRCVRRFQSAAEREADGRSKGYSGVLEADLYRSEAKLAALAGSQSSELASQQPSSPNSTVPFVSYVRGENGQVLPEEEDEIPQSKEEGFERWKFVMTMRFLRGEDQDFDYKAVDENDVLDPIENQEKEEKWFDEEEPEWIGGEEEGKESLGGETGIQDF